MLPLLRKSRYFADYSIQIGLRLAFLAVTLSSHAERLIIS
jgi:hypothetical protein